jgi:AP-3 complex subunit beta
VKNLYFFKNSFSVTSASAKCSIIWLVGEYSQFIPTTAPDVLRVSAKNFTKETVDVKLQIITLAAKMAVQPEIQPEVQEQVGLATTYIFNMARYDQRHRDFKKVIIIK